ncbi:hypothetical protein LSTR_LSTR011062 [Laodelphax striatellus]|uniref:Uncharacterized protein n=1 Tax=Laodelphax striatellus TaxID=195883 RepID=A0A482WGF2_LAOST|nr:hypothetical protein LSTR_LSTR011062 [Laodelphax striatellus]
MKIARITTYARHNAPCPPHATSAAELSDTTSTAPNISLRRPDASRCQARVSLPRKAKFPFRPCGNSLSFKDETCRGIDRVYIASVSYLSEDNGNKVLA